MIEPRIPSVRLTFGVNLTEGKTVDFLSQLLSVGE